MRFWVVESLVLLLDFFEGRSETLPLSGLRLPALPLLIEWPEREAADICWGRGRDDGGSGVDGGGGTGADNDDGGTDDADIGIKDDAGAAPGGGGKDDAGTAPGGGGKNDAGAAPGGGKYGGVYNGETDNADIGIKDDGGAAPGGGGKDDAGAVPGGGWKDGRVDDDDGGTKEDDNGAGKVDASDWPGMKDSPGDGGVNDSEEVDGANNGDVWVFIDGWDGWKRVLELEYITLLTWLKRTWETDEGSRNETSSLDSMGVKISVRLVSITILSW
jgi:hypothetical protein